MAEKVFKGFRGIKLFRGVPFEVLTEKGIDYYHVNVSGMLGIMWVTKKELELALSRAERFRKKYRWS